MSDRGVPGPARQLTGFRPSHKLRSVNRTERLLDLITYLLNAREPVSWQEIKNHFPEDYAYGVEESNQRKFERDKAELISLGIPIDYQGGSETKKEGYLVRKEKLFLPELEFSPRESSLLMLAAGAVRESENFPYRDQLESALSKIISIQNQITRAPEEVTISYLTDDGQEEGQEAPSHFIHELQDALDRRKFVEIRYHAFSTGKITKRKVNPYGLIFKRGKWTLVGWDHLRKDLRSFVVRRIKALTLNSRRPGTPDYEIPEDFSLRPYQHQQPWELDLHSPLPVTLQIAPHRIPELAPQLRDSESLGEDRYRLQVTNRSGLLTWVLSQKSDVQVLEPEEVQHELTERLRPLL